MMLAASIFVVSMCVGYSFYIQRVQHFPTRFSAVPKSQKDIYTSILADSLKYIGTFGAIAAIPARPAFSAGEENIYNDPSNGFSLTVPPGWSVMPRKVPTPSMVKYEPEISLFIASSFAEGASLSVTKSNAPRLLKDFDIEWWFAPLTNIQDLGSPALIAELLILQRQGEFEKRITASEIIDAKIENNILYFRFSTPLAKQVNRETIAKAYLSKKGVLYVLWISGLTSVFEGEYVDKLEAIRNSFTLTD